MQLDEYGPENIWASVSVIRSSVWFFDSFVLLLFFSGITVSLGKGDAQDESARNKMGRMLWSAAVVGGNVLSWEKRALR